MSSPKVAPRPEANGIAVTSAEPFQLDTAEYPWLQEPTIDVPVVAVTLSDGTEFQYGSLIGFSNAVKKIADKVPEADSASAQSHLFTALPAILNGDRHPGIGKVENSRARGKVLLSASRNIAKTTRLIFAVEQAGSPSEPPTVLRAGISIPKDHNRLMKSLSIGMIGTGGHKRVRRA